MFKSILVGFLISSKLYAIDCDGGIKDGAEIRLDSPGKSLANFKTQDQDGLGTCASNTTSLLLHSIIPSHPNLSYVQLASIYQRENLISKKNLSSDSQFNVYASKIANPDAIDPGVNSEIKEMNKWDLGIDSASVCGVIEKAKTFSQSIPEEGICKSGTMSLEKIAGNDDATEWKQKKTILAVSKYMNEFQKNFRDASSIKENPVHDTEKMSRLERIQYFLSPPDKKFSDEEVKNNKIVREKYKAFQNALEKQIKNKEAVFGQKCNQGSTDMLAPVLESMNFGIFVNTNCFQASKSSAPLCSTISKFAKAKKNIDGSRGIEYLPEFQNNLFELIKKSPKPITNTIIKTKVMQAINKVNGKPLSSANTKDLNIILNFIDNSALSSLTNDLNEMSNIGYSKKCNERELLKYLMSDDFKADAKKDAVLCQSMEIVQNVKDVVSSTAQNGISDLNKVREFLLKDANLNFDQVLSNLYAFDCTASDKVKIPNNLNCDTLHVTNFSKNEINSKLVSEIKNNRAVGGSICSAIIDKPKADFREGECGNHAVSIIGLKCINGNLQYLIKNSWGVRSRAKNTAITNITEGAAEGAYWFDSTSFFDGFNDIQTLEFK